MIAKDLPSLMLATTLVDPNTPITVHRDGPTGLVHIDADCTRTTAPDATTLPRMDTVPFADLAATATEDRCRCVDRAGYYLSAGYLTQQQTVSLQNLRGPDPDIGSVVRTVAAMRVRACWLVGFPVAPVAPLAGQRILELLAECDRVTADDGYAAEAGYHLLHTLGDRAGAPGPHATQLYRARDQVKDAAGRDLREAVSATGHFDDLRRMLEPCRSDDADDPLARLAAVWRTACTDLAWYRIPTGALSAGSLLLGSMVDIDPHHPTLVLGPAALWSTGRGVDLTPLAAGDVPRSDVHTAWQVAHEVASDVPAALAALHAART